MTGNGTARGAAASQARLSVDDWTERALALLMDEGVGAIKISRLCSDLGVTKGSFYWHFADQAALMAAISERWTRETREALSALQELHHLPPLERIRAMALRLVDQRSFSVERALREWAHTDARVAEVIKEADQFVFALVQAALVDLGLSESGARLRAGLLVYAGIGFAHGQAALPQPTEDDIEELISFLAGDVGGRS
ncbi:MAG: TetR/AcrR family transcriptional regulator [Nocardioides sp.]